MRPAISLALLALSVAVCSADAAASTGAPKVPTDVPVNGWYKCAKSTFHRGRDNAPDDDYYLETETKHRHSHSHHQLHQKTGATGAQQTGRLRPAPKLHDKRMPFLTENLETIVAEHQHQHKHHHHSHTHNKKSKVSYKKDGAQYECAEFRVPMCYEGICDSEQTIDVFVRRVVAQEAEYGDSERPKSLWVLQGGPGASSTAMEELMETMYDQLDGKVSLYTMDHRGTARSNRLECQAAEAITSGSPGGSSIRVSELPACIDDVMFQIDNQPAAFSVTSAAMDLRTIIDHALADQDVYVYGLSYGTYLVERLIHIAPDSVKGYIVDGIVSETGATVEERSTYSNWDHDVGVVGARLLSHCLKDSFCKAKFPGVDDLSEYTLKLYQKLDEDAKTDGKNACADALAKSGQSPSYFLRSLMGLYLGDPSYRTALPAIIYRTARCSESDVDALSYLVDANSGPDGEDTALDTVMYTSDMLYNLIVFSEMWESPTPDKATLVKFYEDSVMGSDNYETIASYCVFTGSKDPACKELTHLPKSKSMAYERDQYWNVTGVLPDHATALLMSGGLDLATRWMYGRLEYDWLQGEKMLVEFEYAGHCTTFTTPVMTGGHTCGSQILASYVKNNGDLEKVDTSCVNDVYPLPFESTSATNQAEELFGISELYDDEY